MAVCAYPCTRLSKATRHARRGSCRQRIKQDGASPLLEQATSSVAGLLYVRVKLRNIDDFAVHAAATARFVQVTLRYMRVKWLVKYSVYRHRSLLSHRSYLTRNTPGAPIVTMGHTGYAPRSYTLP